MDFCSPQRPNQAPEPIPGHAWLRLAVIALLLLSGCASTDWPVPATNPSGYLAVSMKDFALLTTNDTAGDVLKKMGRPAGEIPLPWFDYYAADRGEGTYYHFVFDVAGRRLRPNNRLLRVELVPSGHSEAIQVWPTSEKSANQPLAPTRGAVAIPADAAFDP